MPAPPPYLNEVSDNVINEQFKTFQSELSYLNLDDDTASLLRKAYTVAYNAHDGQVRRSGEPYITHPIAVAGILGEMRMDVQSILAGLLHDVIEDTALTNEELRDIFGEEVSMLVDGVTKLTQISFSNKAVEQAENLRKMLLAMSRDIRVVIIKLADRLHNMRTIEHMPPERARVKAKETLEIFAPIARRLGMHEVCLELEDRGFLAMYPLRYKVLAKAVSRVQGTHRSILDEIKNIFSDKMTEGKIPFVAIEAREKHLYSIYKKIKKKRISFTDITDVYAVRVITTSVDSCYRCLGLIHGIFKPVPERFKDYIALPKMNGYQSLHTVLFGPYGVPIEVQIRTKEMHEMANNGISAHWLYKTRDGQIKLEELQVHSWIKNLIDIQKKTGSSIEFIENVKIDLFPDEVFVFTPQGPIMQLPAGATVLDFAYAVHTDIGNTAVAAKIDRQMAPLSTVLSNGQTVEIITDVNARPNPAWLSCATTAKAKSSIRHYLKSQRSREAVALGERILRRVIMTHGLQYDDFSSDTWQTLAEKFHHRSFEQCLRDIGLGHLNVHTVLKKLLTLHNIADQTDAAVLTREGIDAVHIYGDEGSVVQYAQCCYPLPGDPIQGLMAVGKGITVHRQQCPYLQQHSKQAKHVLSVGWGDKVERDFVSAIAITAANERGVLAKLAITCSNMRVNIRDIVIQDGLRSGRWANIDMFIDIQNRNHLARVMRAVRNLPAVMKVSRQMVRASSDNLE